MTACLSLKNDVMEVKGFLDRFNLAEKALHSFPAVNKDVELCFEQVEHLDTAGLAWVLKLLKFYQSKQVKVEISNPPQQLIALAKISNVLELLPISK